MSEKVYHSIGVKTLFVLLLTIGWLFKGSSQSIEIVPETIRSCMADSVMVSVFADVDSVLWFNGDTTQYTWVYDPGYYTVSGRRLGEYTTDSVSVYILAAKIVENDTSINCGDSIRLHGSDSSFDYLWSPGDVSEDSIYFFPKSSSYAYAIISESPELYCEDSVLVIVNQLIQVDTIVQSIIGCPGDSVAQVQVFTSGGFPPYSYDWPPEAVALIEEPSYAYGLVDGDKIITITDSINCFIDHPFMVKAHRLPDLELSTLPMDTVYLQNPWVTFSYENPTYDSLVVDTFLVDNQWWDFGDSTEVSNSFDPTYAYTTVGEKTIVLTFKTYLGCFSTDTIEINVLPVKIIACAVITPNDDELNQYFELYEDTGSGENQNAPYKSTSDDPIDLSKYYLSNELVIFNRWGEKVYEVDNYNNDWDGGDQQDGTYFYVIKCYGQYRTDVFKGSFMILGSGGTQ
jgi:hypothetical protein